MMIRRVQIKDRIADAIIMLILLLTTLTCIAPIVNTIAISFSEQAKATAGYVYFWPIGFNISSYQKIMQDARFLTSFWVSVKRVVLGSAINMLLTILMAYPLSREVKAFRARNIYMWLVVFTMLFNGGIIPWYMTIRTLGLMDSLWALVLPGAVPVFNVILLVNFFRGVPKELEEAAYLDGAGPWYTLLKIFIPISKPALATILLFSFVSHWNSFFDGLVLMNKPQNQPLQTYIQQLVVVVDMQNVTDIDRLRELLKISNKTLNAAKLVISIIPILAIYPFLQRYFVTGLVLGSVKE